MPSKKPIMFKFCVFLALNDIKKPENPEETPNLGCTTCTLPQNDALESNTGHSSDKPGFNHCAIINDMLMSDSHNSAAAEFK